MIYCIGSVNRLDTVGRFEHIIPHIGNEEIRARMVTLKKKIDECMNDEEWESFFPMLLRSMAVTLDRALRYHDRRSFEEKAEMERRRTIERLGPKYGCKDD